MTSLTELNAATPGPWSETKIEKGVPLPKPRRRRSGSFPFDGMEIGDSFAVPIAGERYPSGSDKAQASLSVAARKYGKERGKAFAVRIIRNEGIVRCWRVS